MKHVARLKWIASFDMENWVGVILQNGMLVSIGLVIVGVLSEWVTKTQSGLRDPLFGNNVLQFILEDFRQAVSPKPFSSLPIHLGIAILMLTPYVRLIASLFYFACVEKSWKQMFLTAFSLIPLTYLLLLG